MRKKPTRKRPYFTMKSAMSAILRNTSGRMHHGILFDRRLTKSVTFFRIFFMIVLQRFFFLFPECKLISDRRKRRTRRKEIQV